jgi:hypothetical protein
MPATPKPGEGGSLVTCVMSLIDLDQLPFVGMSYDEVNTPCGERRWIDRKAAWEAASDRAITSQIQGAPFSAYIVNLSQSSRRGTARDAGDG